jgi:small multidrug resistance family-3 protein
MGRNGLIYAAASLAEIGGCFAVWAVLRRGASPAWLAAAALCLGGFAWLLTRSDTAFAGRAYAAYGGVYIVASLLWLWAVEGEAPRPTDLAGGLVCLAGAAIILGGARA